MSVKQHPKQRSDRTRVEYLAGELDRWERNLRGTYGREAQSLFAARARPARPTTTPTDTRR